MAKRLHWTQTEEGKKRLAELKRQREVGKRLAKTPTVRVVNDSIDMEDDEDSPVPSPVSLDDAIQQIRNELCEREKLLEDLLNLRETLSNQARMK